MISSTFVSKLAYTFVIYARMSTSMQNPRSPEQQIAEINRVLKALGRPWVCIGIYRDAGTSGRYMSKRRDFTRMMQDIKTGQVQPDLILVDTLERFGRMKELETIRRELHTKYGVLVLTADSGFADPTSVEGQALGIVEAIRSTQDGRVKAHNVLRGKRDAAKLGHWPGGPTPRGYKPESVMTTGPGPVEVDFRKLVPDAEAAPVVQEIFRLAFESGYGSLRIAQHLNADKGLVERWGRIHPDTIGRILDNTIYRGELVYGRHSTDVIDDRRVIRRNAEEDMIRVKNFCEPLISDEVWEKVQLMRHRRGEAIKKARGSRRMGSNKQIHPLAPGMTLKYPLTGLVRCGVCGASLRPNSGGVSAKSSKRYCYYMCPNYHPGSCTNGLYCPEHWLRKVVFGALRRRLYPPPEANLASDRAFVPSWFPELVAQVHAELERISNDQHVNARPLMEQQLKTIRARVVGWTQSLSNADLPVHVRRTIEQELGKAIEQQAELECSLSTIEHRSRASEEQLDLHKIVECLRHLDEVMAANANPTLLNMELSRLIDRVEVFPDGKVVMHTCRLGAFEGLVTMLTQPTGQTLAVTEGSSIAATDDSVTRIRPRLRGKLNAVSAMPGQTAAAPRAYRPEDPHRFAGLSENWFWKDEFEMPRKTCWAAEHATEVATLRSGGMKMADLARHFGVSRPTIRRALKLAQPADTESSADSA